MAAICLGLNVLSIQALVIQVNINEERCRAIER